MSEKCSTFAGVKVLNQALGRIYTVEMHEINANKGLKININ